MNYFLAFIVLLSSAPCICQSYTDVSDLLPDELNQMASMDVRAVDIDEDGDLDLLLANEFQVNQLLINDGNGNFSIGNNVFINQDKDSEDIAVADFNGDGHLDVVFCSEDDYKIGRRDVHEYQWGMGNGTFRVSPYRLPDSEANAVVEAWINDDAYPDLIFGNNGENSILINQGDGRFVDESMQWWNSVSRTTQDIQLADVNGDGLLDIFEGNEDGNLLWLNRGHHFEDVSQLNLPFHTKMETRKVSFADIDSDGDLDVFLSNVAFRPGKINSNAIWINNGEGRFTDETSSRIALDSSDTLDGIFEDVDGDGDLDLIIANVNLQSSATQKIYANNGFGHFVDESDTWLPKEYSGNMLGVISADFNNDKLNDIYWCNRGGPDIMLFAKMSTQTQDRSKMKTHLIYGSDSVVLDTGRLSHVVITDLQGRPIYRVICNSGICKINGSVPAGHYIVLGYFENDLIYNAVHPLIPR